MQLEVPQYLSELNAARDVNILDWYSPPANPNSYEKEVGKLTLSIALDPRSKSHHWKIVHQRSGLLTSGSSESAEVAKVEMITYAMHWVRTAMVGVMQ